MTADRTPMPEEAWVGPAHTLIANDDTVTISARTLAMLVSYALAGPSDKVTTRSRDEAVDQAHRAMADTYAVIRQYGRGANQ